MSGHRTRLPPGAIVGTSRPGSSVVRVGFAFVVACLAACSDGSTSDDATDGNTDSEVEQCDESPPALCVSATRGGEPHPITRILMTGDDNGPEYVIECDQTPTCCTSEPEPWKYVLEVRHAGEFTTEVATIDNSDDCSHETTNVAVEF